jgi:hypothetical protein
MFNFVIGLSISLIIHSVELVQKKFLQQAKTNPALVIPVVLIIAFGIGQLGFQSYGFNILSSLLWMSTSEMIILFGTFMKQLLSTNPKKSITYKILGIPVTETIKLTPDQKKRHAETAIFLRYFLIISVVTTTLILATLIGFILLRDGNLDRLNL